MKNRFVNRTFHVVPFLLLAALLVSGCASTAMKGTPFYTGEYNVRKGPVEDRVNLWPLLYYRDPALSILWPIGEVTDDYFAVRPLLSVYGLDREDRVYNFLWPIAQFDNQSLDYRVFPVFWGHDYGVVFPLYWHFGKPFGAQGGSDTLFPLWCFSRDSGGYSTDIMWPIVNFKDKHGRKGWRVWPIAGNYWKDDDYYRFLAWPLGHQWSENNGRDAGSTFLPLYWHCRVPTCEIFLSLPLSFGETAAHDSSWQLLMMMFFRYADATHSSFASPLYFRNRDSATGKSSDLVLPLFYSARENNGYTFATLLGGRTRERDMSKWLIVPLLSKGENNGQRGDYWFGGPLSHFEWDAASGSQYIFPFYYRSHNAKGSTFVSLPCSYGSDAAGGSWQLMPPFFAHSKDADSDRFLTLLYSRGTADAGKTSWSTFLPLYYSRTSGEKRLFATPIGGFQTDATGKDWLIYPLLSGGRREDDSGSLWLLAPFFHVEWDKASTSHHVLPLYYWNGADRTFISPLTASWKGDAGEQNTLVPPLLSMVSVGDDRKDLWTLGGLAHLSWGEKAGSQHFIPFYYGDYRTGTHISPFVAKWEKGKTSHWICPPLLSGFSSDGQRKNLDLLLGLIHEEWGGPQREGYFLPLYVYKGGKEFYTPLVGWNRDDEKGYFYPLTPLVGIKTGDDYSGGWVFPLWTHTKNRRSGRASGTFLWGTYFSDETSGGSSFFPVYGYRSTTGSGVHAGTNDFSTRFWSIPACWYRNKVETRQIHAHGTDGKILQLTGAVCRAKSNGFFPLWSYSSEDQGEIKEDVKGSLLLLLYDYKRTVQADSGDAAKKDSYVRSRVLWRLWHYERSNEDVSVDVFPAITYDRKQDGFKKISFLWRFFRYERSAEGRKLDLLYIPLMRSKAEPLQAQAVNE